MADAASTNAVESILLDELTWLHTHEYAPWGAHVAAAQEHKHLNPSHAATIQFGLSGAKSALVNDHIALVLGGRDHPVDHASHSCRIDLFDISRNKWLTSFDIKGEMPRRIGHSLVSVGSNRAIAFGGEALEEFESVECLGDCYELAFSENVLSCNLIVTSESHNNTQLSPPPRAWQAAAAIRLGASDAMLILGGRDASGRILGDIWALVIEAAGGAPPNTEIKWVQLAPTGSNPLPLAQHSAVPVDNGSKVVVFGGRQSGNGPIFDAIYILDVNGNSWSQLSISTPSPQGWTARCGLSGLEVSVPVDKSTGRLAQIMASSRTDASGKLVGSPEGPEPEASRQILIFGGFAERTPTPDPSRFALLDKETGQLREIHAPSLGLTTFIGQASLASSDGKSVYIFGGVDARTRQFLDTASAFHFWKPQPGDDGSSANDNNGSKIRTKVFNNGDEYTGEMDSLGLIRHGQGRCIYHGDSGVYEGEWFDDVRSGQGVMTYSNGDTYAGQWSSDLRHGYGILEVKVRDTKDRAEVRFEGQWEHDQRSGAGSAVFSDGSILNGVWSNGELQPIKCRLENYDDGNGVCTYTGEIVDGVPHGEGESQHAREVYTGGWVRGKRCGHGVSILFDGTTYTGDWKNSKRNGFGTCSYTRTRDRYDGKWVGGVRCGRGICRYANGAQYEGEWHDDKCHGLGKYSYPDGTFYEGNWKENKFCGDGALVLDLDEPPALE